MVMKTALLCTALLLQGSFAEKTATKDAPAKLDKKPDAFAKLSNEFLTRKVDLMKKYDMEMKQLNFNHDKKKAKMLMNSKSEDELKKDLGEKYLANLKRFNETTDLKKWEEFQKKEQKKAVEKAFAREQEYRMKHLSIVKKFLEELKTYTKEEDKEIVKGLRKEYNLEMLNLQTELNAKNYEELSKAQLNILKSELQSQQQEMAKFVEEQKKQKKEEKPVVEIKESEATKAFKKAYGEYVKFQSTMSKKTTAAQFQDNLSKMLKAYVPFAGEQFQLEKESSEKLAKALAPILKKEQRTAEIMHAIKSKLGLVQKRQDKKSAKKALKAEAAKKGSKEDRRQAWESKKNTSKTSRAQKKL